MSQNTRNRRSQESDNVENLEADGNDIVRCILCTVGLNVPFNKADIIKTVFAEKPGKTADAYFTKAATILQNTYGLTMKQLEMQSSVRKYVVINALPVNVQQRQDIVKKQFFILLVLAHILMSKNCATDTSLWQFMRNVLQIDISSETEIEDIGNLYSFVNKVLTKQKYITYEIRGGVHELGEPKKNYRWGPHAEQNISKMEVLKFVSDVEDGKDITKWNHQFDEANRQFRR